MLEMTLIMRSFFFGCDGGLRRSFFGTNFLWLGWEIKAIFFWDEQLTILAYTREFLPGTNGFLSKVFFSFFNTRTELQGGKSQQYDDTC